MKRSRLAAVVGKETREILRDRATVVVAVLMPLVMLFLFGYGISMEVDDVRLGLVDQDRSPTSRALVERFVGSGYFRINGD